jgi:O-antigen/teichoic acid export membrane protein
MPVEDFEESKLVDRAMSAFRWVAALRFMGQMVSWLSTIFVIRFLAPEDYGVLSLAEIFRTFLILFSTVGLSQGLMKVETLTGPLIQKTLGLLVAINSIPFLLQFSGQKPGPQEDIEITFVTDVLASCLSLTMAFLGYGYWALVAAIVFTALFNCLWFNRIIDYPLLSPKGLKNCSSSVHS